MTGGQRHAPPTTVGFWSPNVATADQDMSVRVWLQSNTKREALIFPKARLDGVAINNWRKEGWNGTRTRRLGGFSLVACGQGTKSDNKRRNKPS